MLVIIYSLNLITFKKIWLIIYEHHDFWYMNYINNNLKSFK